MLYWILTCHRTGETQEAYTCEECEAKMPLPDGDLVQAYDCDDDVACEFCEDQAETKKRARSLRDSRGGEDTR
tara:strand:+ start:74 stop:292 length:219 start_codon:yes stop_codon:yes gene_type:complete